MPRFAGFVVASFIALLVAYYSHDRVWLAIWCAVIPLFTTAEWVLRRRKAEEERYAAELLELEAQIEAELAMDKANPRWREEG